MTNYKIIHDETMLDEFLSFLPETDDTEVFYLCLFARRKYAPDFPNSKDHGQIARLAVRKCDLKSKIRQLEVPLGAYVRDGVVAPQESLALYIGLNPRSLFKANKHLLVELAERIANGNMNFNPISLAKTTIHNATDRKFFLDFDYDLIEPQDYLEKIQTILPAGAYRVLKTRGGFHIVVILEKVKSVKSNWHYQLSQLPNCDVKGTKNLTPVPGCVQGGFVPHFIV